MISDLILIAILSQSVSFSNAEGRDMILFKRLAKLSNVAAYETSASLRVDVEVLCSNTKYEEIVSAFDMEYGKQITDHRYIPSERNSCEVFTIEGDSLSELTTTKPKPGIRARQFANTSLVYRAFMSELAAKRVSPGETVIACSYSYHPWISRSFKRTETIEGSFTLEKKSKTRLLPFYFDPD